MKHVPIGEIVKDISTWQPALQAPAELFNYLDIASVDKDLKEIVQPQVLLGAAAPSRARQKVVANDVIVSTVRPNLNTAAVVPTELDGATASTGFCVLRCDPTKVNHRYLFRWVTSQIFVDAMSRVATGASYPAVSDGIILSSKIPLPPLPEQRRIAAILDHADAVRAKRRAAIAKLDSLAQSIFHFMVARGLKSGTWPILPIEEAGRIQLGRQRAPQFQTGRFTRKYVRVANVFEDRLNLTDVLEMDFDEHDFPKYRLKFGDILLNEGQSTELVGRPAMWRNEIEDCCFQNTLIRFQPNPRLLLNEFALAVLLHYFRTGEFAKISSKTSSVAHLGASRFARMPIPVPPLEIQQRTVAQLNQIRASRQRGAGHLSSLDSLYRSLQYAAFGTP